MPGLIGKVILSAQKVSSYYILGLKRQKKVPSFHQIGFTELTINLQESFRQILTRTFQSNRIESIRWVVYHCLCPKSNSLKFTSSKIWKIKPWIFCHSLIHSYNDSSFTTVEHVQNSPFSILDLITGFGCAIFFFIWICIPWLFCFTIFIGPRFWFDLCVRMSVSN